MPADAAGGIRLLEYDSVPMASMRDLEHAGIFEVRWAEPAEPDL